MSYNLSDVTVDDNNFRGLIVAPNGRGKTCLYSSFPKPMKIFDFDKRVKPLLSWIEDKSQLEHINVDVISASNYMDVFHYEINSLVRKNPYRTVVIDGITGLSTTTVMMQMAVKGLASKNDKDLKIKMTKGGVPVPEWDEFNGEAMLISQLIETLKDLNCNLIFTAHPVPRINANGGTKFETIVAFGNKVNNLIPGYFDEIYYIDYEYGLQGGDVRRVLQTKPSNDFPMAKTAYKEIPARIDITDNHDVYSELKRYF
jgi:hypothetical protein